ncbi:MAG: RluA family pseudouridine synthase [Planctomycetota bacterium]
MPNRPTPSDPRDQPLAGESLLARSGQVDPDAILAAIEEAQETGDDDANLRTVRFEIRRGVEKRLDKYLTERITFLSRNQIQQLIDDGGVTVNGRKPKASTKLSADDVVDVVVPPPPSKGTQPEDIALDIMFEDEHIIVLNKQPDIICHPARAHRSGTLINALAFHFQNRSKFGGDLSEVGTEFARPGVVHRLDRDTTGCIVFAKSNEAHWKLGHQFEQRRVDKRYLAVVHGRIEPVVDVIDLPIGPHQSKEKGYREKQVIRHDELGRNAVTIYRVRERYNTVKPPAEASLASFPGGPPAGWNAPAPEARRKKAVHVPPDLDTRYSLVELELKTGRTHQIRVHLSYLDWPIVGDDMYAGVDKLPDPASPDGPPLIARQALHAAMLGFTHPITSEPMQFTAPLRGDLLALVWSLRSRSQAAGTFESHAPQGATVDIAKLLPGG